MNSGSLIVSPDLGFTSPIVQQAKNLNADGPRAEDLGQRRGQCIIDLVTDFFHAQGVLWVLWVLWVLMGRLNWGSHGWFFACWLMLATTVQNWGLGVNSMWRDEKEWSVEWNIDKKKHGFGTFETSREVLQMLLHTNADMLGDESSRKTSLQFWPNPDYLGSSATHRTVTWRGSLDPRCGTGLVQVSPLISVYHRIHMNIHRVRVDILSTIMYIHAWHPQIV